LCSTLSYTDLHINLCSTMTVDGSAFDKPQIGPAYANDKRKKSYLLERMYWQEHFVPIMKTKGLELARCPEQLIRTINDMLKNRDHHKTNSTGVLEAIITYSDGKNTARVANRIKDFLVNSCEA
jgi:hypothetical protein